MAVSFIVDGEDKVAYDIPVNQTLCFCVQLAAPENCGIGVPCKYRLVHRTSICERKSNGKTIKHSFCTYA